MKKEATRFSRGCSKQRIPPFTRTKEAILSSPSVFKVFVFQKLEENTIWGPIHTH